MQDFSKRLNCSRMFAKYILLGYEENYFFVVRHDGVYYNELETRVRLSKRRQKVGQAPSNTRLMVKHRPMKANEFKMQRYRERQLEPPGNYILFSSMPSEVPNINCIFIVITGMQIVTIFI